MKNAAHVRTISATIVGFICISKQQTLSKPTRRMRLEYIVGGAAEDLAAVFQFDESMQNANKFAHIFEDNVEVVRAHLAQVEACIYLVITYAMKESNESSS